MQWLLVCVNTVKKRHAVYVQHALRAAWDLLKCTFVIRTCCFSRHYAVVVLTQSKCMS